MKDQAMQRRTGATLRILGLATASLTTLAASTALQAVEPSMRTKPDANEVGIWKSYVPHGMRGEFYSYDPVGLMAGALIRADCSINWRDPDTGKLFCFSTGTSLNYFQDFPKANTKRAREGFDRLQAEGPGS
jgi:hypothetical protein